MCKRLTIDALDKMIQDINDSELSFGGKVVVFGGDLRQVLPVVPKATKEETINASLVNSYLWPILEKIRLNENMIVKLDSLFCEYLLRIGDGTEKNNGDKKIKLPTVMTIPYENENTSIYALINVVFPNIYDYSNNLDFMINRAILTPTNDCVDEIDSLLIQQFPNDTIKYFSFDETLEKSEQSLQEDFLNMLIPNGLPPHELILKPGCPIMLLRNINPSEGLCNGIRLICHRFESNVIDTEIAVGYYDIIALAIDMHPIRQLKTKQGASTIQEIILVNRELKPILLIMWDQFVDNEAAEIAKLITFKPVIIAARLKVVSYNDTELSILNGSILEGIVSKKSYLTFASGSTIPTNENILEIGQIESLLTKEGIVDIENVVILPNLHDYLIHAKATTYESRGHKANKLNIVAVHETENENTIKPDNGKGKHVIG
ncbi:hypothetical protein Ddye_002430 [Dipteronia dyeriana]|uniref:ATP-dependent DNA helicase n=1 Tax=Dipteronia dyeriana TaxID=168575 RepID=A0AAD9XQA3_9ROSI|nr:hypothetical protein Ddye_002430 [Dipteronia dyeriana]